MVIVRHGGRPVEYVGAAAVDRVFSSAFRLKHRDRFATNSDLLVGTIDVTLSARG